MKAPKVPVALVQATSDIVGDPYGSWPPAQVAFRNYGILRASTRRTPSFIICAVC